MTEGFVAVDVIDGVAWMTLTDPARLNPVTIPRITMINQAARELSDRDDVRVIVLTGAGRGFCSGADLADEGLRTVDRYLPASGSMLDARSVWTLSAVRQPVIAMVNGPAVGYGMELALQADIRIAGQSARFGLPYVQMGAVTDTGAATWLMPRIIGLSWAAEILFTGQLFSANDAAAMGLVSRVVPDDELLAVTKELTATIAAGVPAATQALKRMLVLGRDQSAAEHTLLQYDVMNQHRPDLDAVLADVGKSRKRPTVLNSNVQPHRHQPNPSERTMEDRR
jgi:enoyl-CoA hydratase/carnithine racemase